MRGQVLGVDLKTGEGQISGEDGKRYRFQPADWSDRTGPAVGAVVDFEANEKRALSIYHVPGMAPALPVAARQPSRAARSDKNKMVAALLAFFLGIFGVHRFYLGQVGTGIVMLLLTCTMLGVLASGIWALIDSVKFLLMSNGDFDERYNDPS